MFDRLVIAIGHAISGNQFCHLIGNAEAKIDHGIIDQFLPGAFGNDQSGRKLHRLRIKIVPELLA